MKAGKLFRILSLAIVLCLIIGPLAALPALAASESIELDPDEAEIGEEVEVTGEDFDESYVSGSTYYDFYVTIYFSDIEVDEGDDVDDVDSYEIVDTSEWVDEDGEWSKTFDVPDELTDGDDDEVAVSGGEYYVFVTYEGDDEIVAVAEITVMAPEVELNPEEGPVGEEVEITGVDFAEEEDLTVEFDDEEIDIEDGDEETDDDGEFSLTVYIPEATAGDHTITVTDGDGSEGTATFTVEPEITLDKSKAAVGDNVTVYGTGFGSEVDVSVKLDGTEVNAYQTDDYGNFQLTFKVPSKSTGTYDVEAKDEDKNKAEASLTLAASISLSPANGNVGTQVTVSGNGFNPSSSISITYAGAVVANTTADSDGKMSANFKAPTGQSGAQTVTASDGSNTATGTFTMETVAPSIPSPLEPLAEDKARAEAAFDWDDVTDPSGVTYSLQVATDQSFSSSSLVLSKTDITDSGYTLTKEEKLPSTDKDAPYYWRVQAVDGAGNQSGWTTPGAFFVGFSWSFPTWAMWLLIGIGGILLLMAGLILGRRSSYM